MCSSISQGSAAASHFERETSPIRAANEIEDDLAKRHEQVRSPIPLPSQNSKSSKTNSYYSFIAPGYASSISTVRAQLTASTAAASDCKGSRSTRRRSPSSKRSSTSPAASSGGWRMWRRGRRVGVRRVRGGMRVGRGIWCGRSPGRRRGRKKRWWSQLVVATVGIFEWGGVVRV